MKIIGLTGYARVGKDTVGAMLVRRGWVRLAFADNVRALALAADPLIPEPGGIHGLTTSERLSELVAREGWEAAKAHSEVRRTLQAIGSGVRTVLGTETWVETALGQAAGFFGVPGIVVTDVRYANEAEAIRSRGGVVVRVDRPGTGPANGHVTEVGVDAIDAEYILVNGGDLDYLAAGVARVLGAVATRWPAAR